MPERSDHQVAGRVRKPVEQDEIVPAPEKDEGSLVILEPKSSTEDAAAHVAYPLNVFFSPGGGDILHQRFLLISSLRSLLGLK